MNTRSYTRRNRYAHTGLGHGSVVLTILLTQITTVTSAVALSSGAAWINEGAGMHPLAAGAIALAGVALPYVLYILRTR